MLASWTLGNFKSVSENLTLPLSPITLLVGANSSGKSSIIQSILLIKQTLQYATIERPIALNGPLLKLGNYNDIKNAMSQRAGFEIGWTYDVQYFAQLFPKIAEHLDSDLSLSPYRRDVSHIECKTMFDIDNEEQQSELSLLQPHLRDCELYVAAATDSDDIRTANVQIARSKSPIEQSLMKRSRSAALAWPSESLRYSIEQIDPETRAAIFEDHPNGEIVAASIRHFFPAFVAVKFDAAVRRATHIADAITNLRKTIRFQRDYASLAAPDELIHLISSWREANAEFFPTQESLFGVSENTEQRSIGDIIDLLLSLRRRMTWNRANLSFPSLQDLHPKIIEILSKTFKSEIDVELERLRLISEASFFSREYFENYVRYLGPLRDEPKPLYPLEALSNPTDVGFRGENTAAVLHLNQYTPVSYIASENFKSDEAIPGRLAHTSLQSAVVDWLSYMGVVEGVSTGDRGKIGHDLQVRTAGLEKYHDLTNVGVGVSQVLPIVLMALLAPTGSLLIFEQPELHLHPRVQTRLADFFISISLAGKQCLVETHSEYLIHRLRRRVAEAPNDDLTKLSRLYFVERSKGVTSCRDVDITKYGAIVEWPSEFFDQSQIEAEKIIFAAAVKRETERKSKRDA